MEAAAPVQWLPALLFLVVGLALGAGLVLWARRGKPMAPPSQPLDLRDLLGRRDALLVQLRELEDTAAKRNPEQLARERYDLEMALARTLRDLDVLERGKGAKRQGKALAAEAAPSAASSQPSALRGFLWGISVTAAIGLLLYFVSTSARPREGGASVTGNLPERQAPMGQQDSQAEERELKAAIAKNPKDLEARLRLTRVYLARQDMMAVWRETQEILKASPGNPQALSYQALVRLAMGQGDVALEMLQKALKADPDSMETYIHLSLVYARLGRTKDSDATIEEAEKRFPDQAAMLQNVQQEIRQAAKQASSEPGSNKNPHEEQEGAGSASAANPHAGMKAPAEEEADQGQGGERAVSGVIDLDPSVKGQVAPGTVVFVFVREAGFGAGPPIAAKRLTAGTFPMPFEITASDAMRGDPIPKEILLEARADSDGDPTTRSPEDPVARLDDLKTPASNVRLVLKRKAR